MLASQSAGPAAVVGICALAGWIVLLLCAGCAAPVCASFAVLCRRCLLTASRPSLACPQQALGLATVLGGVLAVLLVTCSDGALALMGAGPETGKVHEMASEFLTIRWGLGCSLFTQ